MGPALVTIDLDDYDDVREIPKPKGPNSEDYRLERRWKSGRGDSDRGAA